MEKLSTLENGRWKILQRLLGTVVFIWVQAVSGTPKMMGISVKNTLSLIIMLLLMFSGLQEFDIAKSNH